MGMGIQNIDLEHI